MKNLMNLIVCKPSFLSLISEIVVSVNIFLVKFIRVRGNIDIYTMKIGKHTLYKAPREEKKPYFAMFKSRERINKYPVNNIAQTRT